MAIYSSRSGQVGEYCSGISAMQDAIEKREDALGVEIENEEAE